MNSNGSVRRVATCRLTTTSQQWNFSQLHSASIDHLWEAKTKANPKYFNGRIHLLGEFSIRDDALTGRLIETDFRSYLYWREQGYPETGVRDGFGSALIVSMDGHVILGRQGEGGMNAGLAYLPGGFIDPRDIASDGAIDIEASIAREIVEETGLTIGGDDADLQGRSGFYVTTHGPFVSMAREYRTRLTATEFRDKLRARFSADPESELADAVIIRNATDIADKGVSPYARVLLEWLFAAPRTS